MVAPLFDFTSSVQGVHALGEGVTLKATDHAVIRQAMDAFLSTVRTETDESFVTYLSPHERGEFEAAHFCLEYEFDAPDSVVEADKRSRAEVDKVLIGMRVAKPTTVRPVLYLRWEYRGGTWEIGGVQKGSEIYPGPSEPLESFNEADVALLARMMPRVRLAYSAHGWGHFNRVANGLNFFEMGYRSNWPPVRFVVFTTALESLFVTSDDSIGRQFRERVSRFLLNDSAAREHLEDTCKQIYDARSTIVHGQPLAGDVAVMNRLMLEVQEVGRRSLQKILVDDAVFGTFCRSAAELARFLERAS
jgi:hypothetical protein